MLITRGFEQTTRAGRSIAPESSTQTSRQDHRRRTRLGPRASRLFRRRYQYDSSTIKEIAESSMLTWQPGWAPVVGSWLLTSLLGTVKSTELDESGDGSKTVRRPGGGTGNCQHRRGCATPVCTAALRSGCTHRAPKGMFGAVISARCARKSAGLTRRRK